MRAILLALLLVAVPLAAAGAAEARRQYCYEFMSGPCCIAPDPVGAPGSTPYAVVEGAGTIWLSSCATTDRAVLGVEDYVDCVVWGRC